MFTELFLVVGMLASPDAGPRNVDFVDLVEVAPGSKEEARSDFNTSVLLASVERSLIRHSGKGMRAEFELLTSNWHTWVIENALLCEAKLSKQQVGDKLEEKITSSLMAADRKADAAIVKWKFELAARSWPELPCDAWPVARLVRCVNDLMPSKDCSVDPMLTLQLYAVNQLKSER
jgi:hypothetical protein